MKNGEKNFNIELYYRYQHSFTFFTTLVNVIYVSYRLRVYSVKTILALASPDRWKIGFVFRIITEILQTGEFLENVSKNVKKLFVKIIEIVILINYLLN